MQKPIYICLFILACLAPVLPGQDGGFLILKDGRRQQAPRIESEGDNYILVFSHGNVKVPKKLVSRTLILSNDSQIRIPENATAAEKKKYEKGLVPFEGKWLPKSRALRIIEKRKKEILDKIEDAKKHSKWITRHKKASKHFKFEFTVTQEIANGYIDFFEEYWRVFSKQWRIRQPPNLGKLKVYIYSDEKEFLRIGNMPKGVLGFFKFVEPLELNFFHNRKDPAFTRAVLWHEANHYMMHLFTLDKTMFPGWLEEGLAEYFGGSSYDPKTKKMTPGLVQEARLVMLHDEMDGNNYKKLKNLLVTPRISAIEYAWSWSLCHMFLTKSKYKRNFLNYIKQMAKSRQLPRETWPGHPDFRWLQKDKQISFFKKSMRITDLTKFEKEWYAYIKEKKFGSAFGYVWAARLCRQWDRPLRAKLYYEKALKVDPNYLPTYEPFADHLLDLKKLEPAKKMIEKGLALDPLNPGLYLMLGRYHYLNNDVKKATRFCNLAMDLVPHDVDIRFQARNILD